MSTPHLTAWEQLRRTTEQLELELHLGGMEARSRWLAFQPRIAELERRVAKAGATAGQALVEEIEALAEALRGLRNGLEHPDS